MAVPAGGLSVTDRETLGRLHFHGQWNGHQNTLLYVPAVICRSVFARPSQLACCKLFLSSTAAGPVNHLQGSLQGLIQDIEFLPLLSVLWLGAV